MVALVKRATRANHSQSLLNMSDFEQKSKGCEFPTLVFCNFPPFRFTSHKKYFDSFPSSWKFYAFFPQFLAVFCLFPQPFLAIFCLFSQFLEVFCIFPQLLRVFSSSLSSWEYSASYLISWRYSASLLGSFCIHIFSVPGSSLHTVFCIFSYFTKVFNT